MPRLIDADTMREEWLENGENEYVYDTNAVLDSIDSQPTVNQWIPVTERLPEQDGYYLCCIDGDVRIVFFDRFENAFGYDRTVFDPEILGFMESEFTAYNVTHWMPMPEPPKEDTE